MPASPLHPSGTEQVHLYGGVHQKILDPITLGKSCIDPPQSRNIPGCISKTHTDDWILPGEFTLPRNPAKTVTSYWKPIGPNEA